MPTNTNRVLVVTDGEIGGLLACWSEGVCSRGLRDLDRPAPIGWFPAWPGVDLGERLAAAKRQAELCQLADLVVWDGSSVRSSGRNGGGELSHMLLAAAQDAAEHGAERVIWPAHAGGAAASLDTAAAICDRAHLVSQLVELDLAGSGPAGAGGPDRTVRIETPYADFGDRELAELALDMDAPLAAAWWCEGERPAGRLGRCGACGSCRRWEAALELARRGGTGGSSGPAAVTMGPRAKAPASM